MMPGPQTFLDLPGVKTLDAGERSRLDAAFAARSAAQAEFVGAQAKINYYRNLARSRLAYRKRKTPA